MKKLYLTPSDNLSDILTGLKEPATIYLKSGVYKQKIEILSDDVTIIGEGRETTIITYDDYARKIHADGKEYNTFRTFTLLVSGERVKLQNLTVENSNTDPKSAGQCVALSVNARRFSAENCDFKSTQDTVFLYPFPDDLVVRYADFLPERQRYLEGTSLHLFENCRVYGTVDFIFGGAEGCFKDCEIISLDDGRGYGFVAAPCHHLVQEHGLTFVGCNFRSEGAADGSVWLARPWRDFGKSVFINCKLGRHVNPALFDKWNDTARDRTARFYYYGLDCDFTPAAVKWAKELSASEADTIIQRCNAHFMK